jgi:AraC-like DNA-binding protein
MASFRKADGSRHGRGRQVSSSAHSRGDRDTMVVVNEMKQSDIYSPGTLERLNLRTLGELHSSEDPVVAHEAYFPASMQGRMHSHARAQLICATTSAVDVVAGEQRWTLQPGHAAWLPGGLDHSVSSLAAASIFRSLYIRPDLASKLGRQASVVGLSPLLQELLQRLIEIYDGHGDRKMYPHLAALTLNEIERAEPGPEIGTPVLPIPRDRRLKLICNALMEQPSDRRTLEEWGKAAGASTRTLERLFRDETEMSFNAWRQACRIAAAIPKLQQGSPVQLVAWEVGYDSPSAFAAIFRRVVGINPTGLLTGH